MASLFASYGNNKAEVKLSADAQTKIELVADNVFAKKFTAEAITSAIYTTSAKRVTIDNQGLMLASGSRIEISSGKNSGYIKAPKILATGSMYTNCGGASNPTSPGDNYKVLNSDEVDAKVSNGIKTINKKYITNTLKGDKATFDDYVIALLTGLELKIAEGATFHYKRLYRSLEDVIKAVIGDVVTDDRIKGAITQNYIKTKLKEGTEYSTFDGYLTMTVINGMITKDVSVKSLKVTYDGKATEIVNGIIDHKIKNHKHSVAIPNLYPSSDSTRPYGLHGHSGAYVTIDKTQYSVYIPENAALTNGIKNAKWYVAGTSVSTGNGSLT